MPVSRGTGVSYNGPWLFVVVVDDKGGEVLGLVAEVKAAVLVVL